ncbi:DnaA N-terminal domain-containing protein [Salipiger abyssi]|uniref:DnaA N-terminal domain-containing protein n=1 Tax=Salipiger abyssi TaxID=1250539 RepID=UPI004058EE40
MNAKRFTGASAGSQKYDLLTALAVAGLNGSPGFQTSMLRLVALVTARYNWARNELTVGQREMARLWSVDERTVKREIKRLTSAEVLLQLRPGVRGRVAAYRLNIAEIHRLSAPVWERVGPDFSERMAQQSVTPAAKPEEKVVHVRFGQGDTPAPEGQGGRWGSALSRLEKLEPSLYRNWFAGLSCAGCERDVLRLKAPSAFVAQYIQTHHMRLLMGVAQAEYPGLRRIEIEG